MKYLTIATLAAMTAFSGYAVAQSASTAPAASTPANKVDCEKAKMKWDEKGGKDGKGACVAAAPATGTTTAPAMKK